MDSQQVRESWADRSGEYSPGYYAYYGPNDTSERLREHLDAHLDASGAILEIGCSSGRHLAHLLAGGYGDLSGVEINEAAVDVMADSYPELAAAGTFHVAAIQDVVTEFADGQFDAVYSVETLQHLHPDDEWVFDELCRITDDLLVTVENEGDREQRSPRDPPVNYVRDDIPLYYRNWKRIFTDRGLTEVSSGRLDPNTLRVFTTGHS